MTSKDALPRHTWSEPVSILIVDDEEAIAEMLADFIRELGYQPLVAHNGQQALHLARERRPALIITDLMMPLFSGVDLIQSLREEARAQQSPSPPIVLLTAVGERVAQRVQADALLLKPFDLNELEPVISRLLEEGH